MSKVNLNQLKKLVSNMKNYTDSKIKALPEKYDAYILNNAVPESSVTAEQYGEQMTLYKISDSDIVFPENSILTDKDLEYKLYSICKLSETQKCIITYNDGTQDITKNIELDQGRYYSDGEDGLQISLEERYEDTNGKTQAGLFVVVSVPDDSSSPQSDDRLMHVVFKYFEVKKITLYIDWYKNQLPDGYISDLNFDKITNLPYDIQNLKDNEGEILTKEEKTLLKKNLSQWGSENIDYYNKAPYTTSAENNIFSSGNDIKHGITVKAKKPALGKGLKIEPFYYDCSYALYYRKSPNVVIDVINSEGTIIDTLDGNEEANILQFYSLRAYTFDKNNDCYFVFSLKKDAPTDRTHGVEQFHLIEVGDPILTYADVDKKLDKKEISKYALMSYVDDTVVFKKLSSIIELNSDGKKIINAEKFEDNKVYYFINDINEGTTTIIPILLYKGGEKNNIIMIYPNDRFITMSYNVSANEFFSFSDMQSVKFNLVDKTREYNTSRSVTKKVSAEQVLTKTNTTEFTPTSDYHPTTKKYVDDKVVGLATESYVDSKTSMENVIYEGNGTGADVISDYWTGCPVVSGNGCWVINKQIEFDSSKPNPYYLLCDTTLYSPENSTFDATNSAWIYPKVPNRGTIFICNKYNNENKLVLPWDDVSNPQKIKLYTKTELATAISDGDLEATSDEVKAMLANVLGGDYSGKKN